MSELHPATPAAYELFHRGALAFAEIEHTGMRIDVDYLDRQIVEVGERIARIEAKLKTFDEYKLQRRRYAETTNLTSRPQLATVLFEDMGHECQSHTSGGKTGKRRPQLDESALERIGTKYCQGFLKLEKLNKLKGTYLTGVRREVEDDGFLHNFFNLHTVVSFRGSSSDINFQNIPIRVPEFAKIIRQAFIPRDEDYRLVDLDYSAQEVRVACNLCKDPTLIRDTLEGDMHRDMAAECYLLPVDEVSKSIRGAAKGGFVFAEFYGDWYKQVAKNLWSAANEGDGIFTKGGMDLLDHLNALGITELGACDPKQKSVEGTYEDHIRRVEDRFWNERFKVYHGWRQDIVKRYRRQGWFELVTGFVCSGVYTKNQVINYPVQGPAFHCLLWSLIRLVQELKKRKMRSRVIGQIHDSIIGDVHKDELDDYVEIATRITTEDIMKEWRWITVPLAVEVDVAESNWFEKAPYEKPKLAPKVCVACGGTGRNSKGGPCTPCQRIKEMAG